jgi:pimeloyl-ACP methyl ester carboxylesterase
MPDLLELEVDVEGGRLFVEEAGAGPAVVLIHSCLVDRRQWDDQMRSFPAAGYRTIRYDIRGFGRSTRPEASWSPDADLLAITDALEIDRAALVGNSCGGGIAVDFAVGHTERVWALVPVAAGSDAAGDPDEALRSLWKEMAGLIEAGEVDAAQDLEREAWTQAGRFPRGDDRIRQLSRDNVAAQTVDGSLARDIDPPAAGRLGEVRAPTLVVQAEHDFEVIQRAAAVLEERIPGASRVVIPGTDHIVNLREPEAFDREVLGFLADARPKHART